MNAQITYVLKRFEFYIGGENLTNYHQPNAIIANNDAFGPDFDASMIWGPLDGVKVYGGLRFTLPYKQKENKFRLTSPLK